MNNEPMNHTTNELYFNFLGLKLNSQLASYFISFTFYFVSFAEVISWLLHNIFQSSVYTVDTTATLDITLSRWDEKFGDSTVCNTLILYALAERNSVSPSWYLRIFKLVGNDLDLQLGWAQKFWRFFKRIVKYFSNWNIVFGKTALSCQRYFCTRCWLTNVLRIFICDPLFSKFLLHSVNIQPKCWSKMFRFCVYHKGIFYLISFDVLLSKTAIFVFTDVIEGNVYKSGSVSLCSLYTLLECHEWPTAPNLAFPHQGTIVNSAAVASQWQDHAWSFSLRSPTYTEHETGKAMLQPLRWCCVGCVIHHERDVREEQHHMVVWKLCRY